jgi:hypothetical protein
MQKIRDLPIVSVKSPRAERFCVKWNAELLEERSLIERENNKVTKREMEKIRLKRRGST